VGLASNSIADIPLSVADAKFDATYRAELTPLLGKQLQGLLSFPFATRRQALDLLKVDGVVGGRHLNVGVDGLSFGVSFHTVKVAPRAYLLRNAHGRWPDSLLEIGGGHGRFVRDIALCAPGAKLFYCDLPLNLLLAARYLTRLYPKEVSLVWTAKDRPDPNARITLLAPWRLDTLPEDIEIYCNFDSMQHMSMINLAYYTDVLVRKRVGRVFHINRAEAANPGEVDLDAYPWWEHFEVERSEQLATSTYSVRETDGTVRAMKRMPMLMQYLRRRT
jgi:putative sugar O-methyltransferase